jgi:hypothetical protein
MGADGRFTGVPQRNNSRDELTVVGLSVFPFVKCTP